MNHSLSPSSSNPTPIFLGRGQARDFTPLAHLLGKLVVVVSDDTVNSLYGTMVAEAISKHSKNVVRRTFPAGEKAKTLENFRQLSMAILELSRGPNLTVVALGGGVTLNLVGFVAGTLYRGVPLIHVPTSLLAQVDAAVDRKQSINTLFGKNTLGSIYAPSGIIIDPEFLRTLPSKESSNGFAEIIKHGLTQSENLTESLIQMQSPILDSTLDRLIRSVVELKLGLLGPNPGEEAQLVLQYGHAIGHAIELASNFSISHGEAISIGMYACALIAFDMQLCGKKVVDLHELILSKFDLPTRMPNRLECDAILKAVSRDKYSERGMMVTALVRSPGVLARANGSTKFLLSESVVRRALRKLSA